MAGVIVFNGKRNNWIRSVAGDMTKFHISLDGWYNSGRENGLMIRECRVGSRKYHDIVKPKN